MAGFSTFDLKPKCQPSRAGEEAASKLLPVVGSLPSHVAIGQRPRVLAGVDQVALSMERLLSGSSL